VHTDERAWRIGADGEELVAAQLERLGPAWKTLHAVPVGARGSDIDHVVIGPGGVYTVNSKHHPGASVWVGGNTVLVNGSKTWYVRNSRHEAQRAAAVLSARAGFPVHVTGLIAMIGDRDKFTVKSQPPGGDVHVLTRRKVADWLSHRGTVLSPEQVTAVFEIARRSTTWAG
jgi:Nuclease-related domain